MKRLLRWWVLLLAIVLFTVSCLVFSQNRIEKGQKIDLPAIQSNGTVSVEKALLERRSVRRFQNKPLTLQFISQLLWAGQGITDARGLRTAPSAGALYPLDLYLVAGNVSGLEAGVYQYLPKENCIQQVLKGDRRNALKKASLNQDSVGNAPAVIVISGVVERTKVKYGERAIQYVYIETGHVAQNIYLQAEAMGLGTVFIGAFRDGDVRVAIGLNQNEVPLAVLPLGQKP